MLQKKKEHPKEKLRLHPRNKHRERYDFKQLIETCPELNQFVKLNNYKDESIDFFNPEAVKTLNKALLKHYYGIDYWDIPPNYLCPPIPGRVDYIHYLSDLLSEFKKESDLIKRDTSGSTQKINVLDIGTGASCIYPILGAQIYNWQFVASDIDPISIEVANANVKSNKGLSNKISCRLQPQRQHVFKGIIKKGEFYHLTMCNPPFHKSLKEANAGSIRKWNNLNKKDNTADKNTAKNTGRNTNKIDNVSKQVQPVNLNFGGQKAELWCAGGEVAFIQTMIQESKQFKNQVLWFTCLVSKKDHLGLIKLSLKKANASHIKIVNMAQGQKISRFIAWSFIVKA